MRSGARFTWAPGRARFGGRLIRICESVTSSVTSSVRQVSSRRHLCASDLGLKISVLPTGPRAMRSLMAVRNKLMVWLDRELEISALGP